MVPHRKLDTVFTKMSALLLMACVAVTSGKLTHSHDAMLGGGPPPLPAYTPAPTPASALGIVTSAYSGYGYSPKAYYPTSPAPSHAIHGPTPSPSVGPVPTHPPPPGGYGYAPVPVQHVHDPGHPPSCSKNTTKTWCLHDHEYPTYDIQHAIEYHYAAVAALYKDVIANTDNSVDRLKHLSEETSYLCRSQTSYAVPLRAINTDGKWRIIVNSVKAHYETLSQTVRLEECLTAGLPCPLVPECYDTKCLQKFVYHRFLVYDPYDYYFPFSVETFKLPAACACHNAGYESQKH